MVEQVLSQPRVGPRAQSRLKSLAKEGQPQSRTLEGKSRFEISGGGLDA